MYICLQFYTVRTYHATLTSCITPKRPTLRMVTPKYRYTSTKQHAVASQIINSESHANLKTHTSVGKWKQRKIFGQKRNTKKTWENYTDRVKFLQFAPHCVTINDGWHVLYICIARIGKIESITEISGCKISKVKWEFQAAQLLSHYTDFYSRTPVPYISAVSLYIYEVCTYVQIKHIYTFAAHNLNVALCNLFFIDECPSCW